MGGVGRWFGNHWVVLAGKPEQAGPTQLNTRHLANACCLLSTMLSSLSSSPLWLLSIDIIFYYALAAGGAEFLGACQVLVTVAHWNKFVHLSSDNIYTNIFHFSNQCKCMEISFKRNMTWRIFKMNKDIYDPNFVQCNALVFALQSPSHSTSPLIQWLSVVEACFDLRVTFAA